MAEKTIQIADKPTVDEILALLENAEVGLAALRLLLGNSADAATMNAVKGILENGTYGLNALDKDLGTITNYLANSTYGLAALKNAITGRANETTVAAVKALLENGTYGLNALKTALAGNLKTIKSVQRGTVVTANNDKIYTISVSTVNTSKSFVMASGGALSNNDTAASTSINTYIELISATAIRIGTSLAAGSRLSWQLVEFY